MKIYFAGVSGKQGEKFFIKRASRLYSYIDLIDSTRGFGAEDRIKEFIKAKRRKR
jgi:hypothetical protein